MDFQKLLKRDISPPFVPKVDEMYFDTEYLEEHFKNYPDQILHI